MLPMATPGVQAPLLHNKRPVFVVGSPRSGTSLLYHTLLSSGGFAVYDQETNFFSGLATRVGNLAERRNRERLIGEWLRSDYFKVEGLNFEALKQEILCDGRSSGDFLRIVMENLARSQNVQRWAEKTPDHVLYLQEIKRTLPDALIIHVIRDGRDVALSLDRIGFLLPYVWSKRSTVMVCGLYWQWMVEVGTKFGATLGRDYLQVHFEDLVQDPQGTLGNIGKFIDHDLDYARIQQVGIHTVRKPNTSFRSDFESTNFQPVKRWERYFPESELAKFESLVGPTLKRFGYRLKTAEKDLPKTLELRGLRAYYRGYFSFRHWIKSQHFPIVRGLIRDR